MVLIRLARDARVASVSYSSCLVRMSALISDIVESRSDHLFSPYTFAHLIFVHCDKIEERQIV